MWSGLVFPYLTFDVKVPHTFTLIPCMAGDGPVPKTGNKKTKTPLTWDLFPSCWPPNGILTHPSSLRRIIFLFPLFFCVVFFVLCWAIVDPWLLWIVAAIRSLMPISMLHLALIPNQLLLLASRNVYSWFTGLIASPPPPIRRALARCIVHKNIYIPGFLLTFSLFTYVYKDGRRCRSNSSQSKSNANINILLYDAASACY